MVAVISNKDTIFKKLNELKIDKLPGSVGLHKRSKRILV